MRIKVGVLPALVTLGNLMCGFAAIGVTAQAQLHWRAGTPDPTAGFKSFALAGSLVLLAMLFDALDGKIARMANQSTEFGGQLDSLCDMVSFGVAPAYIVFLEATSRTLFRDYRYAWVCAVLYAICAALRLARFNVEKDSDEERHKYFHGLPTPAAAGIVASLAIFEWKSPQEALWAARTMPFAAVLLGGLMITRVKYIHLLNLLFRERKPFTYLVLLVFGIFTVWALAPYYDYILLAGFGGYVLSGPIALTWKLARRRAHPTQEPGAEEPPDDTAIF